MPGKTSILDTVLAADWESPLQLEARALTGECLGNEFLVTLPLR